MEMEMEMGTSRSKSIEALMKNTHISESTHPHHEEPQNPEIKHENQTVEVEQFESSSISSLPKDTVLDILSRLPINTVGNCNCVCKSWYRAIHTPLFSTMQLKRAPRIKTLIIQDNTQKGLNSHLLRQVELDHDYQSNSDNSNEKFLIGLETPIQFQFLGSCNGLLCLVVPLGKVLGDIIFVGNPVLGEYMALPPPSAKTDTRIGYGFGFDSVANEYKIIRMAFSWIDFAYIKKPSFELVAEVYTMGSDMWRNIGNVPYPINAGPSSAFVNGALHWMSDSLVCVDFTGLIVSFDVAREEFRVLPHPPGFSHGKPENYLLDLGVLGGRLCLLDREFSNAYLNIWVMKEYGVEKSWTQQYVIRPHLPHQREELHLILLSHVMNDKILFLGNGKQLICYDPPTKTLSILGIKGLPSRFSAEVYEGSLISLGDLGELASVASTYQTKAW